ncbi:MAG: hypothetical protein PHW60_12940 [Kiritimatiellae bacterium]|nr:hypothetical protein [Kiritimatiellia bacterium]
MPRGIQPVELFVIVPSAALAGQEAGHVVLSVGLGPSQGRVAIIVAGVNIGAGIQQTFNTAGSPPWLTFRP